MLPQREQLELGIAVIGCGHWGPNHIRNFSLHRQTRVLYCVDSSEKHLAAVSDLFPQVRAVSDLQIALQDPAVDAVVIATPASTHFDICKQAIQAGKHVLCEKPLARTAAEAETLKAIAAASGRMLMVGHVFVFNAGIVKLRELITSDELGRVRHLHAARRNLGPVRYDVDCTWDLASHDISIFNYLLGSVPTEVSARSWGYLQQGVADAAFITLSYPENVVAHVHVSWLDPEKVRQITVVGDLKMAKWDDLAASSPITIYNKKVVSEPTSEINGGVRFVPKEGDVVIPKVLAREPLKVQADYFVSCVLKGKIDRAHVDDGIAVVRVLEAVEKSVAARGAAVPVRG